MFLLTDESNQGWAHFLLFLFVAALFIVAPNENSPEGPQLMYGLTNWDTCVQWNITQ